MKKVFYHRELLKIYQKKRKILLINNTFLPYIPDISVKLENTIQEHLILIEEMTNTNSKNLFYSDPGFYLSIDIIKNLPYEMIGALRIMNEIVEDNLNDLSRLVVHLQVEDNNEVVLDEKLKKSLKILRDDYKYIIPLEVHNENNKQTNKQLMFYISDQLSNNITTAKLKLFDGLYNSLL